MARKLRVVVPVGWHHLVNRGDRREAVFPTDTARQRFLGHRAELPDGFRAEIHAMVRMCC